MKKTVVALLLAAVCGIAGFALFGARKIPGRGGRTNDQIAARLEQFLSAQQQAGFAGVVLVVRGDDVLLQKGYGLANRENKVPFTEDTVFTVGSITKQFTGAGVMALVMDEKLSVDDTLDQFFNDVPPDKRGITIHQLLTHTAGFPDALGDDFDVNATKEWMLQAAMEFDLLHPPGEKHHYSNTGYCLLAAIIEHVSGERYEQYLRSRLFEPAGMYQTGIMLPEYDPGVLAVGYEGDTRWGTIHEKPMLPEGPTWNLLGGGGIHSTVGDILRWHRALQGGEILSEDVKKQYFAPHVDEGYGDSYYGYGWVNWETDWGARLLSHNGGNGYFAADCHRYVDDDALIFVATNGDVKAWDLMDRLETIALDCEK